VTRHYLAFAVLGLVALNNAVTIFVPEAREMLEQQFNALLLVLTFYFSRN
jgi:hypothetical protein